MKISSTVLVIVTSFFAAVPAVAAFGTETRRAFLNSAAAAAAAGSLAAPPSSHAATTTAAAAAAASLPPNTVVGGKMRLGDESIMSPKAHGTSDRPVQSDLRYGVSAKLADKICNYNRHFAEFSRYFRDSTLESTVLEANGRPITFYDSVTGKPLFVAPVNRSAEDFLAESRIHGWPSFRDDEVVWDNVRVLKNSGETVSVDGTHLGHNLPDRAGNRYCINLVSIAGEPAAA